jgi:hypothetical protein
MSKTKLLIAFFVALFLSFTASAQQTEKKSELQVIDTIDLPVDMGARYVAKWVDDGVKPRITLDEESFKAIAGKNVIFAYVRGLCTPVPGGWQGNRYILSYVTVKDGAVYATQTDLRHLFQSHIKKEKYFECELQDKKILVKAWR